VKSSLLACDNIPTPAEDAAATASARAIGQPSSINQRRIASEAFEEAQVEDLNLAFGPEMLGTEKEREQVKATGGSALGGTGRMDFFGARDDSVSSLLFEMKNSDFDAMKPERVRANTQSHARQLHRYLGSVEVGQASSAFAMMFAVYKERPSDPVTLAVIEDTLAERGITPVWAEDYADKE
jgi:hypothetical protein